MLFSQPQLSRSTWLPVYQDELSEQNVSSYLTCFNCLSAQKTLKGSKQPYSTTSPNSDYIRALQDSLTYINMGVKVDANFDASMEKVIAYFQGQYQPTSEFQTLCYQIALANSPKGVVDKDTLLALDEAVVLGWEYETTLQSSTLIQSCLLDMLAKGEDGTEPYGKSLTERHEVALIQEALNTLGFNVGNIDGKLWDGTIKQINAFQKAYPNSEDSEVNTIHDFTLDPEEPTKEVNKDILLALDEALVTGWVYKPTFVWHDPVDNPMLCLYSQGGHLKPHHGSFGEKIRDEKTDHAGMDLFAEVGSNIYAAVDGVIQRAYISPKMGGKTITIKIADSTTLWANRDTSYAPIYADKGEVLKGKYFDETKQLYLTYMHLDEFLVKPGTLVKAGDLIAKSGRSGKNGVDFKTKNPHLHFAISSEWGTAKFSQSVNPMMWIKPKYEDSLTADDKKQQEDAKNAI